jgi:hypothetical protein
MSVEAQADVTRVLPETPAAPSGVDLASYFHRIWPPIALAIGLIITVAWIGFLVWGLFELREMLF